MLKTRKALLSLRGAGIIMPISSQMIGWLKSATILLCSVSVIWVKVTHASTSYNVNIWITHIYIYIYYFMADTFLYIWPMQPFQEGVDPVLLLSKSKPGPDTSKGR